jgi:putative transposase
MTIASWPSFDQRLWQRNYYEQNIRDDESLNRIRQCILDNPRRWAFDRESPEASASEAGDTW